MKKYIFFLFILFASYANAKDLVVNGSVTGQSFQATKSNGVAGDDSRYEANGTDTSASGRRGADSLTYSYRGKDPGTRAAGPYRVEAWTNVGETGTGSDNDPYVQIISWFDLGTLAPLTAPVFITSIEAPYIILGSAATAAGTGVIRLPNAGYVYSEASPAGTDISVIGVDSSEVIQIGASGASSVNITPALTVASVTTSSNATTGGSVTLPEGTNNGTNKITIKAADAIAADATITVDSVDFNFGAINILTTGNISGLQKSVVITHASGVHDGSNNVATVMTDSGESFTASEFVGMTIYNVTDGSSGTITANTSTTITATLSGGSENDWDTNDVWQIGPGPSQSGSVFYVSATSTIRHPATKGYVAAYYVDGSITLTIEVANGMTIVGATAAAIDAGDTIDSPATAGSFIVLHNKSTTSANAWGKNGTWTDGGAS